MISLLPATPDHIPALARLAQQAFTETFGHLYSQENLAAHLNSSCSEAFFANALQQGDTILLACDGDTAVGYAKYGAVGLPVEFHPEDAELHRLYVLQSHQGQGVGARLMDAALAAMSAAPVIYLGVWEENYKARKFYANYGFEDFGTYLYYVGRHVDNELILRRSSPK